jgi:hypothetical protein
MLIAGLTLVGLGLALVLLAEWRERTMQDEGGALGAKSVSDDEDSPRQDRQQHMRSTLIQVLGLALLVAGLVPLLLVATATS